MKKRITRRYLAGLLDGEGYFGILPENRKTINHYKPVIKMALAEKDAFILSEIVLVLGGYIGKRNPQNPNHNISYCWQVSTFVTVQKVLDYVRPYLIIKKNQADIMNEFLKTKQTIKAVGNVFAKLDHEVINKRTTLYRLLKTLNSRGKGRPLAETKCKTPCDEGEAIVRSVSKDTEFSRNAKSLSLN